MKIVDYQKAVKRTVNKDLDTSDQILNCCLGLSGETGEVIDLIKKEFFQGHKRNNDKLKDEIGDIFWYLSNLCSELGYDIETIFDMNIEKLNKRYPDGFKEEDSTNRDESTKVMLKLIDNYVGERDIIENKTNIKYMCEDLLKLTFEKYYRGVTDYYTDIVKDFNFDISHSELPEEVKKAFQCHLESDFENDKDLELDYAIQCVTKILMSINRE